MNFLSWIVDPTTSMRLVLALLHFLWQGCACGLVAVLSVWLVRGSTAGVRYMVNVLSLLTMAACLPLTFLLLRVPLTMEIHRGARAVSDSEDVHGRELTSSSGESVKAPAPPRTLPAAIDIPEASLSRIPLAVPETHSVAVSWSRSEAMSRWVAIFYVLGVTIILGRLLHGMWGGHQLRRSTQPVDDAALLEMIRRQSSRLGLWLTPAIGWCHQISIPVVVGIARPMIMLPSAVVIGLTPDQLQALMLHELAHIRRFDPAVNLLQRLIEALLFFHPVVWFISHRVSVERELAADDMVLAEGWDRPVYAEALLRIAELSSGIAGTRSVDSVTALGAMGKSPSEFRRRVLRLLGEAELPKPELSLAGLLAVLLAIGLGGAMAWSQPPVREVDKTQASDHDALPQHEQPKVTAPAKPRIDIGPRDWERLRDLVNQGVLAVPEDKTLVDEVIGWRLEQFEQGTVNKDLPAHKVRSLMQHELKRAAEPRKPQAVHQEMLRAVVAHTPRVLQSKDFACRLNAAILLADLNETDDSATSTPCVAAIPLLKEITAKETEHLGIRAWGIKGLTRMLAYDQLMLESRAEIVRMLVELLENSNKRLSKEQKLQDDWIGFNHRLVEGLGHAGTLTVGKEPLVFAVLARILFDREQAPQVQTAAARSLSQLPLDSSVNVHAVVWQSVRVMQALSSAEDDDTPLDSRDHHPDRKSHALTLYFAFHTPKDADSSMQVGFLNQSKRPELERVNQIIKEANDLIASEVKSLLGGQPGRNPEVDQWLRARPPKDLFVGPDFQRLGPLVTDEKLAAALTSRVTSLADAVQDFNLRNRQLNIGLDQPPLTEDEVVQAIRAASPPQSEVTKSELAAFKSIAETRQMLPGTYIRVVAGERPDPFTWISLWSIRISLTVAGRIEPVTLTIRHTKTGEERIDPTSIAWGPMDEDGLSLGLVLLPIKDRYQIGDSLQFRLFVRNTSQRNLSGLFLNSTAWPRRQDILVSDQSGARIGVRNGYHRWSGPPWVGGTKPTLEAGEVHAMPVPWEISLGGEVNQKIGLIIEAHPGQKLQVRVRARNGKVRQLNSGESLSEAETGAISLVIAEAQAE